MCAYEESSEEVNYATLFMHVLLPRLTVSSGRLPSRVNQADPCGDHPLSGGVDKRRGVQHSVSLITDRTSKSSFQGQNAALTAMLVATPLLHVELYARFGEQLFRNFVWKYVL